MKKFLCAIISFVIVLTLSGCGYNKVKKETTGNEGRATLIYNDGYAVIYQDNETGVQYFSRSGCGTCVMVNPDGTPYTGQ